MDNLDKQLLEFLSDDALQSAEVLAKRLSTSASTVRRRIKRLVGSGAIRIVALSDPDMIGLPITALMGLDVAPEKLDSVMQALDSKSAVRFVAVTIGRFDIIALLRLASTEDLFNFVQEELTKLEGVRNSETFICVHWTKRSRHLRF